MRHLVYLLAIAAWAQPTRPPAPTNPYVRYGGGSYAAGDCAIFNTFGYIVSNGAGCGGNGEVNTASNVGASGVGVYNAKAGVDLQFRKLDVASNKVTVVLDGSGTKINFDIVPGNILLSGIGGFLGLSQLNTTGTPDNTKFLRGDGLWAVPAGTISSISLGVPSFLTASGTPCTTGACALAFTVNAQSGRKFLGSPADGTSGTPDMRALVAADIPANLTSSNAASATVLDHNPANCSAGQSPLGVDASGAAEGCFTPSGVSAFTGLTDCQWTRASNVYSMSACYVMRAGTRVSVPAATATLSGSSGASTLISWFDENGLNVGHVPGATIVCVNCTERTAVTTLPASCSVVPLFQAAYTLPSTFADPTDTRTPFSTCEPTSGDSNVTVGTPASGKVPISLSGAMDFSGKTTRVNQMGTLAGRPTTCVQMQTYTQTDGTVGLYMHTGAAGACSFSFVGPISPNKWTYYPVASGKTNAPVYAGGWFDPADTLAPTYPVTNLPPGINLTNGSTTDIQWFGQVPSTYDGTGVKFRLTWTRNSMVGYGTINHGLRVICTATAAVANGTSWPTEQQLTITVAAPQDNAGTVETVEVTVVPTGTCTAGGYLKGSLRRMTGTGNVATVVLGGSWWF